MAAGRRHRSSATPLALAIAALVVYASLFPFTGWRWPPGQTIDALLGLPWPPWRAPWDAWFNLAGYLPLGFMLFVAVRRSGAAAMVALAVAVLAPAALSYMTEVLQHLVPSRHPSLKDLAMNVVGAAAGALIAAAAHALGWIDRWHGLRERWFVADSSGGLALLALWPFGLLFPAPAALGLGQLHEPLREGLREALDGVGWAADYMAALQPLPPATMSAGTELAICLLGMLGPCLVACSIARPGWHRVLLGTGALGLAVGTMALSATLNFGPEHAMAWRTPVTTPALALAWVLSLPCALLPRRLAAACGLAALGGLVALVTQVPADPYFAQSLAAWEQGRFVRFHGLAQWVGWLWPWAAIVWLAGRVAARD